tara:strand:- start:626 stop:772 length:147 start_codon:yes stop_codon:yes gene_type:complete
MFKVHKKNNKKIAKRVGSRQINIAVHQTNMGQILFRIDLDQRINALTL